MEGMASGTARETIRSPGTALVPLVLFRGEMVTPWYRRAVQAWWGREGKRKQVEDRAGGGKAEPEAAAEGYRRTLAWVLERVWDAECPKGASALAKSLWKAAEADKARFVADNMPLLVRGEKEKEQVLDMGGKVVDVLMGEMEAKLRGEKCPTCGRELRDLVSQGPG